MNHFELPVSYKMGLLLNVLKFFSLSVSDGPTSGPGEMII